MLDMETNRSTRVKSSQSNSVEIGECVPIPDDLILPDARVEIEAKKAAGYNTPTGAPFLDELKAVVGHNQEKFRCPMLVQQVVAGLRTFEAKLFSADPRDPSEPDARWLVQWDVEDLARRFRCGSDSPPNRPRRPYSRLGRNLLQPPNYKPLKLLERVKGIEPSSSAWKAVALPLSYTRVRWA
jgi:hypothetical protein